MSRPRLPRPASALAALVLTLAGLARCSAAVALPGPTGPATAPENPYAFSYVSPDVGRAVGDHPDGPPG